MSDQAKQCKLLAAVDKHCADTPMMDLLARSVLTGDIDATMLEAFDPSLPISKTLLHSDKAKKRKRPSTSASAAKKKRTCSRVKNKSSEKRTRKQSSLKTSPLGSTTSGKASPGFWTESVKENSTKLWWPTRIALRASRLNSSNGLSVERAHLSSFSTARVKAPNRNELKTFWRSSNFVLNGRRANENTQKLTSKEKTERSNAYKNKTPEERKNLKAQFDRQIQPRVVRCRLNLLKLTQKQRHWMRIWFKDARKTYNLALQYLLEKGWHRPTNSQTTNQMEGQLVARFVTAASGVQPRILLRTPKVIRQQAVKSLLSTVKTFRTKFEQRQLLRAKYPNAFTFKEDIKFRPKFKSRLGWKHDSIHIEKVSGSKLSAYNFHCFKHWKPDSMFPSKDKGTKPTFRNVQTRDELPDDCFSSDFAIHFNHGQFYLQVPRRLNPLELKKRVPTEVDSVCAIDPGARKFATIYSPEGRIEFLGTNTNHVIDTCVRRIDRRKKRLVKLKGKKPTSRRDKKCWRLKMQKYIRQRLASEQKASEVVKNMHYNFAHHICSSYKKVIYPDINLTNAVSTSKDLSKAVKLRISQLRFGRFKDRLSQTASIYGTEILTGSEAFTSKQCGKCGELNNNLGKSEIWHCPSCGCEADRDGHAARNILLRFLTSAPAV